MATFRTLSLFALAIVVGNVVLSAQDEVHLQGGLEGKHITVKIDMPACAQGVDVFPGSPRPIDFPKLADRWKSCGVAIRDGDSAMITKVKVKRDLVEIQLDGGGYGTSGDVLNTLLNRATDSAQIANQQAARLAAGSRFNLRYPNGASPKDLTVEAVLGALAQYASLTDLAAAADTSPSVGSPDTAPSVGSPDTEPSAGGPPPAPISELRKGLSPDEVQTILGAPVSSSTNGQITTSVYNAASDSGTFEVDFYNGVAVDIRQRAAASSATIHKGMSLAELEQMAGKPFATTTNGVVTTNTYHWQDGVLEADFVNDVLVAYRISSN